MADTYSSALYRLLHEEDEDRKSKVQQHIVQVIRALKSGQLSPEQAHRSVSQVIHYHDLTTSQLNTIMQYLHENPLLAGSPPEEESDHDQEDTPEDTEGSADSGGDMGESTPFHKDWWTPQRRHVAKQIGKGLVVAGGALAAWHGAGALGATEPIKRTASMVSAVILGNTLNKPQPPSETKEDPYARH